MEIPSDVADLLRRLAVRGWKSENFEYVSQVAAGLCTYYGIEYGTTPEPSKSDTVLTRNTAALVEWLTLHEGARLPATVKKSKILMALLGDLSEEQREEHYTRLLKAKEQERTWQAMINRVDQGPRIAIMPDALDSSEPRVRTLRWLDEQLQTAKNITSDIARHAIADNLHAEIVKF